ncbi:MAG: hypothetical protein FWG05_06230, partial [Kiritimatiellaeota bacterium]|nr:hypothetical protein [Kiritimatiellota bacterium]
MKNSRFSICDFQVRRLWPVLLFFAAAAICAIAFAPTLSSYSVLNGPDGMPSFQKFGLFRRMAFLFSETPVFPTFDDALRVLPELARHSISYIVATALFAVAGAAYMRAIGIRVLPACAGGLALAFSGYNWTLFNAGHGGIFISMPYIAFAFALIERIFQKPRWHYFALLPLCIIPGIRMQPDVTVLFGMTLGAYAVFRLACEFRKIKQRREFPRYVRGVFIALVVGVLAGAPTVKRLFTEVAAGREEQIQQSVKAAEVAEANRDASPHPENSAKKAGNIAKHAAWIFATNWSLPPDDCLEFISPTPRGLDTTSQSAPYWGRLGRTDGWEGSKQGFHNFRQHSTYLGAVTIAIAIFGIIFAIMSLVSKCENENLENCEIAKLRNFMFFWAAVFIVALLLAFGRYTPFYRLFYALPFMDKIRAPVKFLHICEFALSVLFAGGLTALNGGVADQRRGGPQVRRHTALISIAIIAALALVCLFATSFVSEKSQPEIWRFMRINSDTAKSLAALWKGALARGFFLLALSTGAIAAAIWAPRKIAVGAVAFVAIVGIIDIAENGSRFVLPLDFSYKAEPNAAAEALIAKSIPIEGARYSYVPLISSGIQTGADTFLYRLQQGQIFHPEVMFFDTLGKYGISSADPMQGDTTESSRVIIYNAFGDDTFRRWEFQGVRAVFATFNEAKKLLQTGRVQLVAGFDIGPGPRFQTPADKTNPRVVLLRPDNPLPTASVFHSWQGADTATAAARTAAARDFDIANTAVLTGT